MVALAQRGEGLFPLPLRMLRSKRLHAVEREQKLEIHRLLSPERAVGVAEDGDALGGRNKIRPTSLVTLSTKSTTDFLAAPSFQDGSASAARAMVVVIASMQTRAAAMGYCVRVGGFQCGLLSTPVRFASSPQIVEKFLPRLRPHAESDSSGQCSRLWCLMDEEHPLASSVLSAPRSPVSTTAGKPFTARNTCPPVGI